jgi:phosphohistidine phosphatase
MRVILMRHADAGDADTARWPDDRERPLSEEGRVEHPAVTRALRRMGIRFDRLLSSPLVRARQTAEITLEGYGGAPAIEFTDALGDRGTVEAVVARLAQAGRDETVLCVGHEPLLPQVAAALISGTPRPKIELRKSGVIAVDCAGHPAPGAGTLVFHLRPRDLVKLDAR